MPNKNITLHLIDVYFQHIHNQQYGFLHRQTLEDDFRIGKAPALLMYSICAVASRSVTDLYIEQFAKLLL